MDNLSQALASLNARILPSANAINNVASAVLGVESLAGQVAPTLAQPLTGLQKLSVAMNIGAALDPQLAGVGAALYDAVVGAFNLWGVFTHQATPPQAAAAPAAAPQAPQATTPLPVPAQAASEAPAAATAPYLAPAGSLLDALVGTKA